MANNESESLWIAKKDYDELCQYKQEYVNMWLDKMRKCQSEDTEGGHVRADDILCELVKKYCPFGNEIVEIFENIKKWYA